MQEMIVLQCSYQKLEREVFVINTLTGKSITFLVVKKPHISGLLGLVYSYFLMDLEIKINMYSHDITKNNVSVIMPYDKETVDQLTRVGLWT